MLSVRQLLKGPAMHWVDSLCVILNAGVITLYHVKLLSEFPTLHYQLGQLIPVFLYLLILLEGGRLIGEGTTFFKDHRNIFTVLVLGGAWLGNMPYFTILLVFNVLRTFHVLNLFPKTRHVLDTLFHALPGVMNLICLILLSFFVFAVLGTYLYGEKVPEMWGTIPQSLLSLQQIMLGDDWGNIVRALTKFYPYAWVLPTVFTLCVSFILLNVFIGIIVDAMQTAEAGEDKDSSDLQSLKEDIKKLHKEVACIRKYLTPLSDKEI